MKVKGLRKKLIDVDNFFVLTLKNGLKDVFGGVIIEIVEALRTDGGGVRRIFYYG